MVKVLLGTFSTDIGTVELLAGGGELVYAGSDPERVRSIVESERAWRDRSGIEHTLTDEELVRPLPYRLQGYILWAVFVDEATGLTQDQPEYDPMGDVWRDGKKAPGPVHVLYSLPSAEDLAREAKQREWNQRAAEWVERVKERAKAQQRNR
jgi:hypothetical protein